MLAKNFIVGTEFLEPSERMTFFISTIACMTQYEFIMAQIVAQVTIKNT